MQSGSFRLRRGPHPSGYRTTVPLPTWIRPELSPVATLDPPPRPGADTVAVLRESGRGDHPPSSPMRGSTFRGLIAGLPYSLPSGSTSGSPYSLFPWGWVSWEWVEPSACSLPTASLHGLPTVHLQPFRFPCRFAVKNVLYRGSADAGWSPSPKAALKGRLTAIVGTGSRSRH